MTNFWHYFTPVGKGTPRCQFLHTLRGVAIPCETQEIGLYWSLPWIIYSPFSEFQQYGCLLQYYILIHWMNGLFLIVFTYGKILLFNCCLPWQWRASFIVEANDMMLFYGSFLPHRTKELMKIPYLGYCSGITGTGIPYVAYWSQQHPMWIIFWWCVRARRVRFSPVI